MANYETMRKRIQRKRKEYREWLRSEHPSIDSYEIEYSVAFRFPHISRKEFMKQMSMQECVSAYITQPKTNIVGYEFKLHRPETMMVSLDTLGCIPQAPACVQNKAPTKEHKESTMFYDLSTMEAEQRKYLCSRLGSIETNHDYALRKQFGLTNDTTPNTFTEFVAAFTAGKYVIADDKKDKDAGWYGLGFVKWRDPSIKEDDAGYRVANAALQVAWQTAKDAAVLGDLATAQTALNTFAAWTYTAPTTAATQ